MKGIPNRNFKQPTDKLLRGVLTEWHQMKTVGQKVFVKYFATKPNLKKNGRYDYHKTVCGNIFGPR